MFGIRFSVIIQGLFWVLAGCADEVEFACA